MVDFDESDNMIKKSGKVDESNTYIYLPTPPIEQDMTQGQF